MVTQASLTSKLGTLTNIAPKAPKTSAALPEPAGEETNYLNPNYQKMMEQARQTAHAFHASFNPISSVEAPKEKSLTLNDIFSSMERQLPSEETSKPVSETPVNHDDEPHGFDESDKISILGSLLVNGGVGILDAGARAVQLVNAIDEKIGSTLGLKEGEALPMLGGFYHPGGNKAFTDIYNRTIERNKLVEDAQHSHPVISWLGGVIGNIAALAPFLELKAAGVATDVAAKAIGMTEEAVPALDNALNNGAATAIINAKKTGAAFKVAKWLGQSVALGETQYDPEENHYISQGLGGIFSRLIAKGGGKMLSSGAKTIAPLVQEIADKTGVLLPVKAAIEKITKYIPFSGYKKAMMKRAQQIADLGQGYIDKIIEPSKGIIQNDVEKRINVLNKQVTNPNLTSDELSHLHGKLNDLQTIKNLMGTKEGYQRYFTGLAQEYDELRIKGENAKLNGKKDELAQVNAQLAQLGGVPKIIERTHNMIRDDLTNRLIEVDNALANKNLSRNERNIFEKKQIALEKSLSEIGLQSGYSRFAAGKLPDVYRKSEKQMETINNQIKEDMAGAPPIELTKTIEMAKVIRSEKEAELDGLRSPTILNAVNDLLANKDVMQKISQSGITAPEDLVPIINDILNGKVSHIPPKVAAAVTPYMGNISGAIVRDGVAVKRYDLTDPIFSIPNESGKKIHYEPAREILTSIGLRTHGGGTPKDIGRAKRLYGALKDDIRNGVKKYGKENTLNLYDEQDKLHINHIAPFKNRGYLHSYRTDDLNPDNFIGKLFKPNGTETATRVLNAMRDEKEKVKMAVASSILAEALERADMQGGGINYIKFINSAEHLGSVNKILFPEELQKTFDGYRNLIGHAAKLSKEISGTEETKGFKPYDVGREEEFIKQLLHSESNHEIARAAVINNAKEKATETGIGINWTKFAENFREGIRNNRGLFSDEEAKHAEDFEGMINLVKRISPDALSTGLEKGMPTKEEPISHILREKGLKSAAGIGLATIGLKVGLAKVLVPLLLTGKAFSALVLSETGRKLMLRMANVGANASKKEVNSVLSDVFRYLGYMTTAMGARAARSIASESEGT